MKIKESWTLVVRASLAAAVILTVAVLFLASASASGAARAAPCQPMVASWYGAESGTRTANGERGVGTGLTAAHKTLPFGTRLRVTYQGNSVACLWVAYAFQREGAEPN